MIKENCENESALLILMICYLKNSQKSNLSLDNMILKWGEISLWNKCFSLIHIGTINGTLLFNTFWNFICQFNSSTCSHIMPDEFREHLTRDQRPFLHPESLQILYITSSMTVLLQFTHSCSTGFRSEDWNGHSRSLVLCSVTHFCVVFGLLAGWKIQIWPIIRFLKESVTYLLFICWYLIDFMMPCV